MPKPKRFPVRVFLPEPAIAQLKQLKSWEQETNPKASYAYVIEKAITNLYQDYQSYVPQERTEP